MRRIGVLMNTGADESGIAGAALPRSCKAFRN